MWEKCINHLARSGGGVEEDKRSARVLEGAEKRRKRRPVVLHVVSLGPEEGGEGGPIVLLILFLRTKGGARGQGGANKRQRRGWKK